MRLPAADLREMAEEALGRPEPIEIPELSGARQVIAGARITSVVHPASKTLVTLDLAEPGETATAIVKYGPTATTRTVAVRF
jgi:hypothetical protein